MTDAFSSLLGLPHRPADHSRLVSHGTRAVLANVE